jgi:PAS domain-containing protein
VRDESGAVAGVLVTFAETTSQVMGERRLTEERDKLNNILRDLNDGLFTVDLDGNILEMNAVALRMHGYTSLEEAQRAVTCGWRASSGAVPTSSWRFRAPPWPGARARACTWSERPFQAGQG